MRRSAAALLSLLLAGLLLAPSAGAAVTTWNVSPGQYRSEGLVFDGRTTLKVEVDLAGGSQITLLLLDRPNFQLFEASQTYQAFHKSTTSDHLTVTVTMEAGTWYVVLFNQGAVDAEIRTSITWESGSGGVDLYISPMVLVGLASVVVIAMAYVLMIKRKGRTG